ncbi:MAG TPA: hypothetical protein VMW28_02690 [Pelolinea sp.]|nr:hypothetical protein [Pelolinea sp.]
MTKNRVNLINRLIAFLLSVITAIALFVSHFTFPAELVLFNNQSYYPVIENEEYSANYPKIISEILISQFYGTKIAGDMPSILSNQDAFGSAIKSFIPDEWSKRTLKYFIDQVFDYFNFRIPNQSLKIELGGLKTGLILNSKNLSEKYINSLNNCSAQNEAQLDEIELTVFELLPCKPEQNLMISFVNLTSRYLEDLFNRLPSSFSTSNIAPINTDTSDYIFYFYSIARWALRLMPLLTISILILIAVLLRKQRDLMLRWIGRLLVITSAISLIGLVIILIGFDQFIALLTNRLLGNLIEGFGVLLLGLIQEVGYQTLVWVVISAVAALGFGFFLLLMGRIFKPKDVSQLVDEEESFDLVSEDISVDENMPLKELAPQTIEEIEEEEKNNIPKGRKKKGNG